MGNLGLYHRFSVTRGMEGEGQTNAPTIADAIGYTVLYVAGVAVSRRLEACVDSLRIRDRVAYWGS
jgi:hypothetical protein